MTHCLKQSIRRKRRICETKVLLDRLDYIVMRNEIATTSGGGKTFASSDHYHNREACGQEAKAHQGPERGITDGYCPNACNRGLPKPRLLRKTGHKSACSLRATRVQPIVISDDFKLIQVAAWTFKKAICIKAF